jgi:hypothetical protein
LGYWVSQAVILQWAAKTTSLGKGIDVASVVGLLLDKEDIRSTAEARRIFSKLKNLECVWTGVSLKDKFEVDHVIPFDLWHNNEAWNLLPASKTANAKKSNKLPSSDLLVKSKDRIVGCWEAHKSIEGSKFIKEAETLLRLPTNNWQNPLFNQMAVAIEITALHRGVGRYE